MTFESDDCDRRDRSERLDHQDHSENRVHNRLAQLRHAGYDEMLFSMDNPIHQKELEAIIAELSFLRSPSETVEVEGVVFLFMPKESAELLGIRTRRGGVEIILNNK